LSEIRCYRGAYLVASQSAALEPQPALPCNELDVRSLDKDNLLSCIAYVMLSDGEMDAKELELYNQLGQRLALTLYTCSRLLKVSRQNRLILIFHRMLHRLALF